jgi:hypothetical protein
MGPYTNKDYTYYSQADKDVAKLVLVHHDMKQVGCCITALASKINRIISPDNLFCTPKTILNYLKDDDAIENTDAIDWWGIEDYLDNQYKITFDYKSPADDEKWPAVLEAQDNGILTQVITPRHSHHWVLLLDKEGAIMDPAHEVPLARTLYTEGYSPIRFALFNKVSK